MGPAQAIRTGFAKTFQFAGRASRSEFWWFAPAGLILPIVVGSQLSWLNFDFWGVWRVGLLLVVCMPLLSAMSRRLQDTGEPGHQAVFPFLPFVYLWLGYQATYWISLATALTGFGLVLAWVALLLFIPLYIFSFVAAFLTTASVMGMMLVASEPGANRYGSSPIAAVQ